MSNQQVHILNGDALKSQLKDWLKGDIIVARECLVDGDDYGHDMDSFYQCRASFISAHYEGYNEKDYFIKTVPEIEKIRHLTADSEVNLWFEDDVFCQVNLWFCVNLLHQNGLKKLWLVRPKSHTQYGFGGLNDQQLAEALDQRIYLKHQNEIAGLWNHFEVKNFEEMTAIAKKLKLDYPFMSEDIVAWVESVPSKNNPGKPTQVILEIIKDLGTQEFSPIFKEFCKRAPVYGYGDLQVKRLLDKIIS